MVQHQWGSETQKLGIKQVDTGQISIIELSMVELPTVEI